MSSILELFLQYPSVTIDSRNVKKGQIYFAIKGARFDGNEFVLQALESGASYCVSSDLKYSENPSVIIVEDTLLSLQQLATEYRKTFNIPFLAITGSNGKTTTKELLAEVMKTKYKVHMTKGNLNNHLGVPLTLLSMPLDTEFAIIEMGANHVGEIDALCRIAVPDYGIVTNIGIAHLEGFGGVEGVKIAKTELYRYLLENKGIGFVNHQEPSLSFINKEEYTSMIGIEENSDLKIELEDTSLSGHLVFSVNGHSYVTNLVGNYNFNNILVALSIGRYFACEPMPMANAVASYMPENNRSQMKKINGMDLILDAYNANPSSVSHAIHNIAGLKNKVKSLILGDMLELGESSQALHRETLLLVQNLSDWSGIFLIGPVYYSLKDEFPAFQFYNDTISAKDSINWKELEGQTVLIKGSRGLKLENLFT